MASSDEPELILDKSEVNRAFSGSASTLGAQIIFFLIQFSGLAVLSHELSPTDFGLYSIVAIIAGIATVARDLGLSVTSTADLRLSPQQLSNLFWVNAAFGFLLAAVLYVCAPLIAKFFHEPEVTGLLRGISPIFIIDGLAAQFKADLTRAMRFGKLALADVISQSCATGVACVIAILTHSVWSLIAQPVLLALVALGIYVGARQRWPTLPRHFRDSIEPLMHGANISGVQILTYVSKNVDNFSLGKVGGPTVLGVYSRAFQLVAAPLDQINSPLTRVALPILGRVRSDRARFAAYCQSANAALTFATVSLLSVAFGVATPAIRVLLGEQWGDVVPIFRILTIGACFQAAGYISYWALLAEQKSRSQLSLALLSRPIVISAILGGLPWGAIGVASGYSLGLFLIWPLELLWLSRHCNVASWPLAMDSMKILLSGGGIGALSWLGTQLLPGTALGAMAIGALFGTAGIAGVGLLLPQLAPIRSALRSSGPVKRLSSHLRRRRSLEE